MMMMPIIVSISESMFKLASMILELISKPIHEIWIPVPYLMMIHAIRMSIVYKTLRQSVSVNSSSHFLSDLIGYLLMSWGGSIVSSILLGLPIPQLLSFVPIIVYGTVYGCVHENKRKLPNLKIVDRILPLIDALLRTNTIAIGVESCKNHERSSIAESMSIQIFIGAICASAGGIMTQSMRVWEDDWKLSKPVFIQKPSFLSSTDLWSGSLIALVYGYLTASHPTYIDLHAQDFKVSASFDAKVKAACLLTLIYYWRAYQTYHIKSTKNSNLTKKTIETASSHHSSASKPKNE